MGYSLSNGPDCPVSGLESGVCLHSVGSLRCHHTLHIPTTLVHTVLPHSLPSIPLVGGFSNSNHISPSLYYCGSYYSWLVPFVFFN